MTQLSNFNGNSKASKSCYQLYIPIWVNIWNKYQPVLARGTRGRRLIACRVLCILNRTDPPGDRPSLMLAFQGGESQISRFPDGFLKVQKKGKVFFFDIPNPRKLEGCQ